MAATFEGVQIASVPAEYDQTRGRQAAERDRRGAQGRPVGRALRDHQRHQGPRRRALPHDERGRRAHRAGGAVRVDRHRLGGDPPRGAAGAGAAASARLRHVPARARALRARGEGADARGRRAPHDRPGGRAVPDPRSRRDSEGRVRRPRGLRSGHRRRHRHLRAAAQLPARHRARDRQRHAGAGPAGPHRHAARPARCTDRGAPEPVREPRPAAARRAATCASPIRRRS